MSQGPTGKPLHAVFKTMETLEFQDELGKTVLQVCFHHMSYNQCFNVNSERKKEIDYR